MRRADLVLAAIPGIVLAGWLAERTASVLAGTTDGAFSVAAALPLFGVAAVAAFGLICYEVYTANAVEN